MNEKMTDVFEHWLQGRINTCVSGLTSRIEHLEVDNDNLKEVVNLLAPRVASLEDEVKFLREFTTARAAEAATLRTLVSCMDTDLTRMRGRENLVDDKVKALDRQASGILHMLDGYGKQLCNLKVGNPSALTLEAFNDLMGNWCGEFDTDDLLHALQNNTDWEDKVGSIYGTVEFNDAVKEAVGEMSLEIRVS